MNRQNIPNTTHYWVVHEGFLGVLGGTLKDPTYADLAKNNEVQTFDSQGGWLGITDKYWMAAAIPPQSDQFTATYKAYDVNGTKAYQSDFTMRPRIVAPNGSQVVTYHLFAGAKVVDQINNYGNTLGIQRFDMAIDWGWFAFITKPMFQAIDFLYRYVGNFGIAILIFTVFVKALFFPLANTSYRSMSKMKKLQPEMERIRERFKTDKVQQQQALMQLYQKEKVNPVSGCLPMVIQIPVFFSLYKVLLVTIDMRHAPFFGWIRDLSAPDPTSIFNLFGLIPWMPPQFLMLGVFPRHHGADDVVADQPESTACRSGTAEDFRFYAVDLHLHAVEFSGGPGDLLELEQPSLHHPAGRDHAINRYARRFHRSAARHGHSAEARTGA